MSHPWRPLPSRRTALAAGAAATVSAFAGPPVRAGPPPVFRLGTLPLGTATWEAATITGHGLDAAEGLKLEIVKLASNEAARIAFVSGAVDTIVGDLVFAARLRAEGRGIRFLPYSTSEGGVMVPAASSVTSLAGLAGKTIGVAGGALDKNWVLLRAAALKDANLDLHKDAKPVFGAPPLLAAKLERGELDAALLYWNFCARLRPKGFREVTDAQSITRSLGVPGPVALLGYLVHDGVDAAALAGFAKASHAAKSLLASTPGAWNALRPLMQAPDEATFLALKAAFIAGIPKRPRAAEIADAQTLFALLARLGGNALVGTATQLPPDLYVDKTVYG